MFENNPLLVVAVLEGQTGIILLSCEKACKAKLHFPSFFFLTFYVSFSTAPPIFRNNWTFLEVPLWSALGQMASHPPHCMDTVLLPRSTGWSVLFQGDRVDLLLPSGVLFWCSVPTCLSSLELPLGFLLKRRSWQVWCLLRGETAWPELHAFLQWQGSCVRVIVLLSTCDEPGLSLSITSALAHLIITPANLHMGKLRQGPFK